MGREFNGLQRICGLKHRVLLLSLMPQKYIKKQGKGLVFCVFFIKIFLKIALVFN